MRQDLIYNNPNNVIGHISKKEIWSWTKRYTRKFNASKLTIQSDKKKYENAICLRSAGKDAWHIVIDWSKVKMANNVETFSLDIKYDEHNTNIHKDYKVNYPQKDISVDDLNIYLSDNISEAIWGTEGVLFYIIIVPKNDKKQWMFKTSDFQIYFKKYDERNGFFPLSGDTTIRSTFAGCKIPLKYISYDSAINTPTITYIVYEINGIERRIKFTFKPRPYSYHAVVKRLITKYCYGDSKRDLFQIDLIRKDKLSPIASKICISSKQPNSLSNTLTIFQRDNQGLSWLVGVNMDAYWNSLSSKISGRIGFNIDDGKSGCTATFSMSLDKEESDTHIQVAIGQEPTLSITPDSIKAYIGENISFKLLIQNSLNAPIHIESISFEKIDKKVLKTKNNKFRVEANKKMEVIIDVNTSEQLSDTALICVKTKETKVAKASININILQRPEPFVEIKLIDVNPVIIGKEYPIKSTLAKCEIGYRNDSPAKCSQIAISDIILPEGMFFRNSSTLLVPLNKSSDVDIVLNKSTSFSLDDLKNGKTETLKIQWQYHTQTDILALPVICPIHYPSLVSLNKHNIEFPHPNESRSVKVCEFDFAPEEEAKKDKIYDTNQIMRIKRPFSFDAEKMVYEIELSLGITVSVYLHINEINEIDSSTINIEDDIDLNMPITIEGDFLGSRSYKVDKKNKFSVKVVPIKEKPKLRVLYLSDSKEIRLRTKQLTEIPLRIDQQSDDVTYYHIGKLLVRNASTIPYNNSAIRLSNIKLEINSQNISINMSNYPKNIEIPNGTSDVLIPLVIDYSRWIKDAGGEDIHFKFSGECKDDDGNNITYQYEARINISHFFYDDVYALDLGTTGIVVAKETDDESTCVYLKDCDNPIEKDDEILSSHTMISLDSDKTTFLLAPSEDEYYTDEGVRHFRIAPSKFIIGQERIPFFSEFYDDTDIIKETHLYSKESQETIDLELGEKEDNEKTISALIASLYKEIFNRFGKEVEQIKKLVITYPNTYTIENLNEIKAIMTDELKLNLNGQISFVPESDAVAAYYFNQKIIYENGFLDNEGNPIPEENVIFYDMGAGTLDLSLVSFIQNEDGGITAKMINKIGIPLAGNYLDYLIFSTLLKGQWVKEELKNKPNTIKELTTEIKKNYQETEQTIGELQPTWYSEHQEYLEKKEDLKKMTYKSLFGEQLEKFIETCSISALKCLLPIDIKVHKIVFSGRGSQFSPLREKVCNDLNEIMDEVIKVDTLTQTNNCGDPLKTCVALGALKYQTYFNNDGLFRIENKNLYSTIAVVYWGKNVNNIYDVNVKLLIDPISHNWENAEFINGTRCDEFDAQETIDNYLSGKWVYYIQTSLDKNSLIELYRKIYQNDTTAKDDLRWAFVNLLFKKRIIGNKPVEIRLKISKDNQIVNRIIGDAVLTDTKLLENVEQNILYKRSLWPFITKLT